VNAFLVSAAFKIIETASALNLFFLALGWALRHVSHSFLAVAVDFVHLRERFKHLAESRTDSAFVAASNDGAAHDSNRRVGL
jgi:hypothetical protein